MTDPALQVTSGARPIFIPEIEEFGGAERSLLALARWLYQRSLPVYLVTYKDHCNLARYASHPLSVVEIAPQSAGSARRAALGRHFKGRVKGSPQPVLSGYQAALHATLAGMRGFHTIMHDTPVLFSTGVPRLKDRLRAVISDRLIGLGMRSGGQTIVNSQFLRADCRKLFNVDAKIVRMGGLTADPDRFALRPVMPGGRFRLLSVCRIEANKRIDWILRSLAALEHSDPALSARVDWHLDLAGKGSLILPLTQLAAELGIAERVRFLGFVSDEDLEKLYAQAHLFLMPAVQGYGLPALESLERGIPIVLHRESGVSDILLDTPWATVITAGPESLTAGLGSAIEGLLAGEHLAVPPPALPTEDGWSAEVARLCGWL